MLDVTFAGLQICGWLEKHRISVNRKEVLTASLCHDIGMVGRHIKYKNNRECCSRHPLDSERIAKRYFPEMNRKTQKIIRCHMWPLTPCPPDSLEGMVVSLADKYCSVRECLHLPFGRKLYEGERAAVYDGIEAAFRKTA